MKFLRGPITAAIGLAAMLFCMAESTAGATAADISMRSGSEMGPALLNPFVPRDGLNRNVAEPRNVRYAQYDRGRNSRNSRMRRRSRDRNRDWDARDRRQYQQDRIPPRSRRDGYGDGRRRRLPVPTRRGDHDRARDAVRQGQALPLGVIVRNLRSYCPGTFLNATLLQGRGGLVYQVRLLSRSGRRQTFVFDATSGAMIAGQCR